MAAALAAAAVESAAVVVNSDGFQTPVRSEYSNLFLVGRCRSIHLRLEFSVQWGWLGSWSATDKQAQRWSTLTRSTQPVDSVKLSQLSRSTQLTRSTHSSGSTIRREDLVKINVTFILLFL
ncbi:hypothetical protein HanRHA438_Chr15g0723281 [Helianthus annuus]|nr:hypothetical protein HanRHA438_Chr15g0723281 [Helianthus annuus]